MSDKKRAIVFFAVALPAFVLVGLWKIFLSATTCEAIRAGGGDVCDAQARIAEYSASMFLLGFDMAVWAGVAVFAGIAAVVFFDQLDE